jgi:hypothetical protein
MTTFAYPGGVNPYLVNWQASGELQVEYSKNPNKFQINQYSAQRKVDQSNGVYHYIDPDNATRLLYSDMREWAWPDKADRPRGAFNTSDFAYLPYLTQRYSIPFELGLRSVQEAPWQMVAANGRMAASQLMTGRTSVAASVLFTAANWGSNTATATSLGGGTWATATSSSQNILNSLLSAKVQINQSTNGMFRAEDFYLVIGPTLAATCGKTSEITSYLKGSPFALDAMRGEKAIFADYGFPTYYAGLKVIVDQSIENTAQKALARSAEDILPTNAACIVCRPEGMEIEHDGPTYTTLVGFIKDDLTTETFENAEHRRINGYVSTDFTYVLVAPASGYLITGCV